MLRFELYLQSTLPYEGALAMAEHLEACEVCAHRLVIRFPGRQDASARRD